MFVMKITHLIFNIWILICDIMIFNWIVTYIVECTLHLISFFTELLFLSLVFQILQWSNNKLRSNNILIYPVGKDFFYLYDSGCRWYSL